MGSFRGHVLPGFLFISLSSWWMYNITRKYLKLRQKTNNIHGNNESLLNANTDDETFSNSNLVLKSRQQSMYKNVVSHLLVIGSWEIPIEGIIKIFGCTTDIIFELYDAIVESQSETIAHSSNATNTRDLLISNNITNMNAFSNNEPPQGYSDKSVGVGQESEVGINHLPQDDVQHATMSCFFLVHSVLDLMTSKQYIRCQNRQLDLDYISVIIAFSVEGFLFYYHILHRTDELDRAVHQMLLITICGCLVSLVLEYRYRNSILIGYIKTFFALLQGTWFIIIAFLLYPQCTYLDLNWIMGNYWDSTTSVMVTATLFAWDVAFVLISMFIVYAFASNLNKTCNVTSQYTVYNMFCKRRSETRNNSVVSHNVQDQNIRVHTGEHYELLNSFSIDEDQDV